MEPLKPSRKLFAWSKQHWHKWIDSCAYFDTDNDKQQNFEIYTNRSVNFNSLIIVHLIDEHDQFAYRFECLYNKLFCYDAKYILLIK